MSPLRQELEGHEAMKLRVLGFVHYPHAAGTQLLDDPVVGNGLANHGEGIPPLGAILRWDRRQIKVASRIVR